MKRYDEAMRRIQVTDDMRARILRRVEEGIFPPPAGRPVRRRVLRRLAPLAACLALLAAGVWGVVRSTAPAQVPPGAVQVVPDMVEAASAEALSDLVGFDVADVEGLPFTPEEIRYTAYWGELAEIRYRSGSETAVFRKSPGAEDNSGDFNLYDTTRELDAGSITAVLKGDAGRFTLAIWSADGFSYSLSLSSGAAADEWAAMIAGIV